MKARGAVRRWGRPQATHQKRDPPPTMEMMWCRAIDWSRWRLVETGGPRGERLEADDPAFREASRSRLDGSRLNTEGGLPPHAPPRIRVYQQFFGIDPTFLAISRIFPRKIEFEN